MKKRCRHERNSWLVCGGYGEWCYVCGAYRGMDLTGKNACKPRTKWFRPTGDKNKNPYPKIK